MTTPILITGAAGGSQGSTGAHVARLLREQGQPVRAFVHRADDRADELRALGAEVIVGDLLDPVAVAVAFDGVRRAYFAYPVADGLIQAATTFASAARAHGVQQTINLSQWLQPNGIQPTPHQTRHWLVEQIFDWADIGAVHLDPTVFYENLAVMARRSLAAADVFAAPWGPADTAIPVVGAVDVARVAAAVLTGPALDSGAVLRLMAGGITNAQIADAFSEMLGRRVEYVEIDDDEWAAAATDAGFPAVAVEHLTHLWRHLRGQPPELQAAYHITDTFERFTGGPPQTFAEFLREHKNDFS